MWFHAEKLLKTIKFWKSLNSRHCPHCQRCPPWWSSPFMFISSWVCQVQELPSQWNLGTPSHPPLLNMSWAWHPVFSSPRCSASAVWVWNFSSFFMLVFVFSSFHIYPIFYRQISFPKFFEIETIDTLRMEPLHSSSIVVLIFSNSFPTDISFSTMMDGLPHREMIF